MRIRKGQARRGNLSARGESHSSDAHGGTSSQAHDKSDEFVYGDEPISHSSAQGAQETSECETIPERVVVRTSEAAPPSWLSALQTIAKVSPTPTDRPYMNLDEFVSSLARENCFPEESDHFIKTGQSSSHDLVTNFSGPRDDDQFIPHFLGENSGWSSIKNADDVDTSLRLAISPREIMAPATDRMKSRVPSVEIHTEEVVVARISDEGRRDYNCTTVTEREARAASILEAGHGEAYEQCYHMEPTTAIQEATEVEVEAGQRNQTMEHSAESMERRPRRVPRSTGRNIIDVLPFELNSSTPVNANTLWNTYSSRHLYGLVGLFRFRTNCPAVYFSRSQRCLLVYGREKGRMPSPATTNEEQTDDVDHEETSSDYSSQRTKSRKRKRKKTLVSVSSSTQDGEKKKQKAGVQSSTGAGESASLKGTKTKKEPKASSNSRSGRPKRLKYMKQENAEKLGNQCNRSDGKGWTCPLLAKAGYQLCDHHLDKLRCKPGSRSKYKKSKKGAAATLS